MRGEPLRSNFAVLLGLAWLVAVAQLLVVNWNDTARTLLDTDDALRLVQVRAFLAGQDWFDLHEARLGPLGYDSHWSRLIDAGLAGLFLFFKMFVSTELAERLVRGVWPLLWLFPAICAVAALAWRIAGREAALAALLLVVIGMPAFAQFRPGRIDHHNVQIVLALTTLAAIVWTDRKRWAGLAAGAATAIGLAVGYEALPFLVLAGAALALHFVVDQRAGAALADYGLVMALGIVALFAATVGPAHWRTAACDALAINMMIPVAVGGAVLAAARLPAIAGHVVLRTGLIAAAASLAGAAFVWLEPRCLAGPFGMIDHGVWAIWLDHVGEMQPLAKLASARSEMAATLVAFPAVAIGAAVVLLVREAGLRRDFTFLTVVAALALAVFMTVNSVKMFSYAMWFGMPVMALAALRLCAYLALATPAARAFVAILLAPAAISTSVVAAVHAATPIAAASDQAQRKPCFDTASYAAMASLPPGLVATEIDYGPFLLALTPHSVIGAPYHRASAGILSTYRLFTATPEKARAALADLGVTYLAVCAPHRPPGLTEAQAEASLYGHLTSARVPDWLEPLPGGPAFTVYRVKP